MARKGRPPATRNRVLNYIEKHRPETIMQVVRATGADRALVYRILWATYGHDFRNLWKKNHGTEFCNIMPTAKAA